jgi:hypothetical protein
MGLTPQIGLIYDPGIVRLSIYAEGGGDIGLAYPWGFSYGYYGGLSGIISMPSHDGLGIGLGGGYRREGLLNGSSAYSFVTSFPYVRAGLYWSHTAYLYFDYYFNPQWEKNKEEDNSKLMRRDFEYPPKKTWGIGAQLLVW